MLNHFVRFSVAGAVVALSAYTTPALADLTDPVVFSQLNALEQAAALANQATYLQFGGSNGRCANGAGAGCTPQEFSVFKNVRELVETSNTITGTGPTTYSLGLDTRGLGFALRWTAAEEMAAQGSSATRFANSQLASLAGRISALRAGARGFRLANSDSDAFATDSRYARTDHPLGGGASADPMTSAWSGFFNGAYGSGSKDPTILEDAFDYDSREFTLGLDRRLSPGIVLGMIAGYSKKTVDFDSNLSVVDGGIRETGWSAILYGLWEHDALFASASVGGQWLDQDVTRRITYPSLNPNVASVNETARSSPSSHTLTLTGSAGYDWRLKAFTTETYLRLEYQHVSIGAFAETGRANGFDLQFDAQTIHALDSALGLKLQYAFTPSSAVLVPFVRGELHKESGNGARDIVAHYSGAALAAADAFAVTTDQPDTTFTEVSGGVSVVLKHGLQGFVQYTKVLQLDNYTDAVLAGGIRLEF